MSRLNPTLEPKGDVVRRIEVITGGGERRRRWSDDEKARAVEESLAPGAVVSEVARRHGLTPQQLFSWRRAARRNVRGRPRWIVRRFSPLQIPDFWNALEEWDRQ